MLEPILQDTSRHLDADTAASLAIDNIFTPLAVTKALDTIRKGTMPGTRALQALQPTSSRTGRGASA